MAFERSNLDDYLLWLRTKYKYEHAWLIGSRARGTHAEDSDWDVVIYTKPEVFIDMIDDPSLVSDHVDLFVVLGTTLAVQPWRSEGCDGMRRKRLHGCLLKRIWCNLDSAKDDVQAIQVRPHGR